MGQKKNSKIILILIILLIIVILLAGVAYAYFATDVFRSNKELFFKYITQMGDENEGFIETQLKQYFEKQKTMPYLDEGSVSVNITSSNNQEQFKNANNMNLTFDGQVDTANSQAMQNISLNYSDNVKFLLSYKQIEDIIGIQTDYIGGKYIAINTSSEDSLTESVKDLEKVKELANVELTKEDLQRIKDTYLNVINQELADSNFSKIEESDKKGYKLTINSENLKNLIVKLLETLQNDQTTLDKINEYIKTQKNSLKITASDLDDAIKYINDSESNNENLEFTVYQTKGKTNCFVVKINEYELKLEKMLTGNDLQYNIEIQTNYDNQSEKIGLIAKFAGLQSMQNITENYELSIETEEMKYQYNYNNNVEFTDTINIETFTDSNCLILSDMEEEQRNNLINAITERIQSVNESQMEELGLDENENPLQYIIPQLGAYSSVVGTLNTSDLDEVEVSTFNSKFENYESTNLMGVTVKGLLSTIQLNNESQEDDRKIKEIHFDGEEYEATDQNITFIKSSVETETAYRVEFERDEDTGIIYRAVINKK